MVIKNGARKKLEIFIRISEKVFGINKYCMMTWGYILQYIVAYGVMIDYNWWGTNDRRGTPPAWPGLGAGKEEPREDKVTCFTYFWIFTGQAAHCIPSQMDWLLDLCLRDPLLRLCSPVTEAMGAKVSTMIFWEVFLRLSQSIDLNILLALLISCTDQPQSQPWPRLLTLDLLQGTMKVGLRSSPGLEPLLPITRYFPFLSCIIIVSIIINTNTLTFAFSAQHFSSLLRENFGFLKFLISSLLPFQALKTCSRTKVTFIDLNYIRQNLPGPFFQSTFSVSLSRFEPSPLKVLRME